MAPSSSSSASSDSSSDSEAGKKKATEQPAGEPAAKKAKTAEIVTSSDSASGSGSGSDSSGESGDEKEKAKKEKKAKADSDSDSDASEEDAKKSKKKDKKEKSTKDKKKKDKKKKDKKDKKTTKGKKKKKDKIKGKKKDKKDKKGKKSKKNKKEKKSKRIKNKGATRDAVSNQYGKFGIIRQEDFFSLKPEFLSWALDVKKEAVDGLGQMKQKDLFKEFVEDYNTATMPSKKYYNLKVWDAEQAAKRTKKNRDDDMTDAQKASLASFDDEKARKEEIKQLQYKKQEQSLKSEVEGIRKNKEKIEEMNHQSQLRTQLEILNKQGRTKEADMLKERMNPGKQAPRAYAPRGNGEA